MKPKDSYIWGRICNTRTAIKKIHTLHGRAKSIVSHRNLKACPFMMKDKNVTTDVLLKICEELNCDISEIMECID